MGQLRIFFSTDIHGSECCFIKFLNAAEFHRADVLILGGDFTGKGFVPLIETSPGTFETKFLGRALKGESAEETAKIERAIRDAGYYSFRTTFEEVDALKAEPKQQEALFKRCIEESVGRWVAIADERLAGKGVQCYISPGNDDPLFVDALLTQSRTIVNPEDQVIELGEGIEMISSGYTTPTPWDTERECSEKELEKRLSGMIKRVRRPERAIYNLHCPPLNSRLDEAPKLDKNLRPKTVGGQIEMAAVGSSAVREAIKKHQPVVGLHGHIHESRGTYKLGKTLCFNPGSQYSDGILNGVVLELTTDGDVTIKEHLLVAN